MANIDQHPSTLRIWLTALRPFSFTVSVFPVVLGTVLAGYAGFDIHWLRFGVLVLAVVSVHAAANLLNDCVDYQRGVDQQVYPVSGAVVRGWLSAAQVRRVAIALLIVGGVLSLGLIWLSGVGLLLLVLVGLGFALGYTRSGWCLKYVGLGDPAILFAFGILPVMASWWAQAERFSLLALWWSIPSGLLAVAILHANNWRDCRHDAEKGCRTLAVRLGPQGCRRYWQGLMTLPTLLVAMAVLFDWLLDGGVYAPAGTLMVLLLAPALVQLIRVDWSQHPEQLAALDARVARFHTGFTFLLCLGFVLAWLS